MEVDGAFFERIRAALRPIPDAPDRIPGLRSAGVLVPLRNGRGAVTVVLGQRTERVPHHKGQVCFPGGSRDPEDRNLLETALREAEEEFGIRRDDIDLLGTLDPIATVTGFLIRPFVARIPDGYGFSLDDFEIAEVFEVPLAVFAEYGRYRYAESAFLGREERVYFLDYGPHTIWGATARILRHLAERVYGPPPAPAGSPEIDTFSASRIK